MTAKYQGRSSLVAVARFVLWEFRAVLLFDKFLGGVQFEAISNRINPMPKGSGIPEVLRKQKDSQEKNIEQVKRNHLLAMAVALGDRARDHRRTVVRTAVLRGQREDRNAGRVGVDRRCVIRRSPSP